MVKELNLSIFQINLLVNLYIYRAASAKQLSKFAFHKRFPTVSNEKYTYNMLAKLIDIKLVEVYKPQPIMYKYSVYYLSSKGLNIVQDYLNIMEGYNGTGWNHDFGYFPYAVYQPPLNQIKHHIMLIDLFINLSIERMLEFEFRNNLYAKRKTWSGHILRMDAEIRLKNNGKSIAIEIDRNTESHTQLIKKFEGYKKYLQDLKQKGITKDIHVIVFIVDNVNERESGMVRRWTNILAAYYKGMAEYAHQIDLHLTTLDDVYNFLSYELDYEKAYTAFLSKIGKLNSKQYVNPRNKLRLGIPVDDTEYILAAVVHPFSTSLANHINMMLSANLKRSTVYLGSYSKLNYNWNLSHYDVCKNIIELYKMADEMVKKSNYIKLPYEKHIDELPFELNDDFN